MKTAYYVDMDGVLCDWVDMFNSVSKMSLEDFHVLSKQERKEIKESMFNYDFFYKMKAINKGVFMLKSLIKIYGIENVFILSAVGDTSNIIEIEKAKRDWISKNISSDLKCLFVDKVENKYSMIQDGYEFHHLIDDRIQAVDSWIKNNNASAYLFKE